jgi:hypothetical protein
MPLPHFTNILSHNKKWEPVHKNLFEISIDLPGELIKNISSDPNIKSLLLENATSVSFPTYPDLGTAEQRFKYSTRLFTMMPNSTSKTDLEIKFNLLMNDNNNIFVFNALKGWYDMSWNNETGTLNYKKDTVGTIIVDAHDKTGVIIRRVVYHNAVCTQFTGYEDLDWSSTSELMGPLSAKFAVDYWEDFYY